MISTVADLTKWAKVVGKGALISPELQAERLKWNRLGDNNDNWHYTFGLEEQRVDRPQRHDPRLFHLRGLQPGA